MQHMKTFFSRKGNDCINASYADSHIESKVDRHVLCSDRLDHQKHYRLNAEP